MQNHLDHLPEPAAKSASTSELVAGALNEARELAKLEVRIAVAELKEELVQAKRAAIAAGVGAAAGVLALAALLIALVLALGGTVVVALILAGALAVIAAVSFGLAYASAPKSVLKHTRGQLKDDFSSLKEHVL
jgi:uncharacterized membrane protein YqjE